MIKLKMNYNNPVVNGMEFETYQIPNKFVYLNRNIIHNPISTTNSMNSGKILINPKFRQSVHLNPHFNKNYHVPSSTSIFVNPNVLKQTTSEINISSTKFSLPTLNDLPGVPANCVQSNCKKNEDKGAVIKNTRTKLVRANCQNSKEVTKSEKNYIAPHKSRQKVYTRYKLIRRSLSNDQSTTEDEKKLKKLCYIKNRFKIDKLSPKGKTTKGNFLNLRIMKKGHALYNFSSTLSTRNVYVKKKSALNKTQFISINGIYYKCSPNKLNKTNKTSSLQKKRRSEKLITIRGQKYKLDANHKTLTCLTSNKTSSSLNMTRIDIGGVTFKKREPNVFVKTDTSRRQNIVSHAKQRSINILMNKMKKCNVPCPFYRKFGRCRGKEKGTCNRVHNPDQISLCPKFLQGACINEKCLLSHKVSPEKMPTCKFFLEGLCIREDCQYLHVKISSKADICKDFLEGFCEKGRECDKRHQYLCPEYERFGKCTKRRCPYPHSDVVSKCRVSKIVAPKSSNYIKMSETIEKATNNSNTIPNFETKLPSTGLENKEHEVCTDGNLIKTRYYLDCRDSNLKEVGNLDVNNADVLCLDSDSNSSDIETSSPKKQRPKVGDLPSFIPLKDD